MKIVEPKVFLLGYTQMDIKGVTGYLQYTGNDEFIDDIAEAQAQGISDGEILCSLYAKLCYKSLTVGKNANITQTRSIKDNIEGCFKTNHGSVFEHCSLNFVMTDVSRVFTHELVRHRVGTAFSQTSGRYVRGDTIEMVVDPILDPAKGELLYIGDKIENSYGIMAARLGILSKDEADKLLEAIKNRPDVDTQDLNLLADYQPRKMDFTEKKKITSALRRILPNGQGNEIGFTCNIRALRHIMEMRTSRHAEWEIRFVFNQVFEIVFPKFPLIFFGSKVEVVDGLKEISFTLEAKE
jgi:thymidylate synthase (FAD)